MPIAWYDNIPVLSYLVLRGKGRASGSAIGWHYPAVELLTAALFVVHAMYLPTGPAILADFIACCAIVVIGTDIVFTIIPDSVSVGGAMVLLVWGWQAPGLFRPHGGAFTFGQMAMDAATGMGVIASVAALGHIVFRKDAMGFGDVKLGAFIGALCGAFGAINALFVGAAVTLLLMPLAKLLPKTEPTVDLGAAKQELKDILASEQDPADVICAVAEKACALTEAIPVAGQIPFGPGLILAAYLQAVWGLSFVHWAWRL
jgi:leader peptidase (prepilin peptidase)/N-methyltransferase